MKITMWGSSHGYAEKNRFTSSILVEVSDLLYLIDAGAPIEWLMVNNDKAFDAVRGIFITHMHNDHVANLSTLIEPMLRYRYNDKSTCFFPSEKGKEGFVEWLKLLGVNEELLRKTVKLLVAENGKFFDDGNLKVYAKPTRHMSNDISYAYVFEADGKRVLFTGDMSAGFSEYCEIVQNEYFDLVVCEMAHAYLCDVAELLKKTNTKRMIINHYHEPLLNGYEEIFKTFPFDVEIAKDGMDLII